MKNNRSLITWGIILLILIGSGLLTIALPTFLAGSGGTQLPREAVFVTIPLPVPLGGRTELVVPAWALMLGLALLVGALVIGAGITLAIVTIIISRLAARTEASPSYQAHAAALEKRNTDKIKQMRATRETSRGSETRWGKAAVVTTTLVIIMFVAFLALLLVDSVLPGGQIVRNDTIINVNSLVVYSAIGITLLILAFTLRPARLAAIDETSTLKIPWDFIAVVVTGLLVVGLGIGVVALLNAP